MTATATPPGAPPLLTPSEAAEQLRCSVAHIRRLCRTGQLAHFRDGRLVRIPTHELHAYINRNTRED